VLALPLADRPSGRGSGRLEGILKRASRVEARIMRVTTGSSRRAVLLAGLLGGLASGGCTLHQAGVTPPDDRIFFPSGGVVDPEGGWLYVVNSNSDLRYNAGTIVAIDLTAARLAYLAAQGTAPLCAYDPRYVPTSNQLPCWDTTDRNILNVDDHGLIDRSATVRIGSFAGTPLIQTFTDAQVTMSDPSGAAHAVDRRLFVPVRGDTSITFMNLAHASSPQRFYCTGDRESPVRALANGETGALAQEPFAACDPQWRITREDDPLQSSSYANVPDDQIVRLPDEPYALALDDTTNLLFVGHLRGYVSLIDVSIGDPRQVPSLVNVNNGVVGADASGSIGITSLTIHPNGSNCGKEIYAASRFRPQANAFGVYGLNQATRCVGKAQGSADAEGLVIVPNGASLSTGVAGSDTRGVEFVNSKYVPPGALLPPVPQNQNSSPDRAFLIQRNPPTMVGIDLSTQLPLSTMEICQGPTQLAQPKDLQGNPLFGIPLLFITCFDSGELYIVDPSVPQIRTIIPVGREPINTVFDPNDPTRAYVITFGENNVSVVDLDPLSPTVNRVIERIGYPSPTPRDVGDQ